MTGPLLAVWRFRFFFFSSAVLLAAMIGHPQSAEVLRVYWVDRALGVAQTAWLLIAFSYSSLVFAHCTAQVWKSTASPSFPTSGRWFISLACATPALIFLFGSLVALSAWFPIAAVAPAVKTGAVVSSITLGLFLAVVCLGELLPKPEASLSARLLRLLARSQLRVAINLAAAAFSLLFLAAPLLPANLFVGLAISMGVLPIYLISTATILHIIHGILALEPSTRLARGALLILGLLLAGVCADAVASGHVVLAALLLVAFVPIVLEYRKSAPSYRTAAIAAMVVFVALIGLGDITTTSKARVKERQRASMPTLAASFDQWLNSRSDLDDYRDVDGKPAAYPVFVVAARGGGLYAAYHTAMVLSHMQDRCPRFAQHIFAISGVSGGSLGAAVFNGALSHAQAGQSRTACDPEVVKTGFRDYADSFFRHDFLSPLVFMAIVPTTAQRLLGLIPAVLQEKLGVDLGVYDRARALEYGFESASAATDGVGAAESYFQRMVLQLWQPTGVAPALVLSTTRADTGEPFLSAPFRLDEPAGMVDGIELGKLDIRSKVFGVEMPDADLRLSTAVGLSGRFPFVTPPGTLNVIGHRWLDRQPGLQANTFERVGFVDGGYFETSGLETAWRLALEIKRARDPLSNARPLKIHVLPIGDIAGLRYSFFRDYQLPKVGAKWFPAEFADLLPEPDLKPPGGSELLAPLLALDASRQYRAWFALEGMTANRQAFSHGSQSVIGIEESPFVFGLTVERNPLPVGWQLASHTLSRIRAREHVLPPGRPHCATSFEKIEDLTAELEKLRAIGEGIGLMVDRWLYACAAGPIRVMMSPAK